MNLTLLNSFAEWFQTHAALLRDCGATAQLSQVVTDSENPAQYADIDLDSGTRMGRITLWASGECDLEALDTETGNTVLWQHVVVRSTTELSAAIEQYVRRLAADP